MSAVYGFAFMFLMLVGAFVVLRAVARGIHKGATWLGRKAVKAGKWLRKGWYNL